MSTLSDKAFNQETWTTDEGIALCRKLNEFVPKYGGHVALTGGLLYWDGPRKDCDIVIYLHGGRIEPIDRAGIRDEFPAYGIEVVNVFTRVTKCRYNGKKLDIIFPYRASDKEKDEPEGDSTN